MSTVPTVPTVSTGSTQPAVSAALTRYRVVAYVVGIGLVVLVCIGVPLKYLADQPAVVKVVGPLHGVLFIVYLLVTADLAWRCRWSLVRTGLVMVAGTVPFMSFVAERMVTRRLRAAASAGADRLSLPERDAPPA
jgi:integral membrane protein